MAAPFNDPGWEIWSCSPGNVDLPRSDYFFEIHAIDTTMREKQYNVVLPGQTVSYADYCKKHPAIYMQEKTPEYPGSIEYPKDEMFKKFGPYFWTSSLSYMLALAIDKKPEAIGLWGVDMSAGEEYSHQRPGCHYFIQEAERAGIDIVVPYGSDILFPHPPYGYREASHMWSKMDIRWKELDAKRNLVRQQRAQLDNQEAILTGAMDDVQYVCNTFHY
jgi:hypothetical protein